MVILAGAVKLAPPVGLLRTTVGAAFAFTRIVTAADVLVPPALSVATAVRL
jgi:hypothetical protein